MPYSLCPLCGQLTHLKVADVAQWYLEFYPDLPTGSVVPGKCFYCWQELGEGDSVEVRASSARRGPVEIGTGGRIVKVLSSKEHGSIFQVNFASGVEHYFIRAELRKKREDE